MAFPNIDQELDLALRSRCPLIFLQTSEEERALEILRKYCTQTFRILLMWDHADYFQLLVGTIATPPSAKDPITALEAIDKLEGQVVIVLRDFHQAWDGQPRIVRKLRTIVQKLKYTKKSIVLISPAIKLPDELKDEALTLDLPGPGPAELEAVLSRLLSTPGTKMNLTTAEHDRLIRSALGLSSNQAQRVFAKALVSKGVLDAEDIALVAAEKKQVIREVAALEFISPSDTGIAVGGLDVLKEWLVMREKAFTPQARAYGLPPPKGICLVGIPGTGKSLTARLVASMWKLPLLRLDVGALFGSFMGESEERARKALDLAATIAPCILWIDEIEKALATGDNDGGTSQRVLGTILSWMQERTKPVFLIATANNISRLPPELLRRGRFDEIFFLDLPSGEERFAIFDVHIRKRKRDPARFDLLQLAAASSGYVGAEIEQAIIDAMYRAFNEPGQSGREFTTQDILEALVRLVPMSRSQREMIEELRRWLAEGRAQSASNQSGGGNFVQIPTDPAQ